MAATITELDDPTSMSQPIMSSPQAGGGARVWRTSLGASILFHGAAVCIVVFGLSWLAPPNKASDSAMTVELAPTVSAPPAPPRQTPPGPQHIEAVVKPRLIDEPKLPPPPPQVRTPTKDDVVVPLKPVLQPDRTVMKQAADQTTAPQAIVAPAKPETAAPTAGSSATASNAPQNWDNLLLAKLQRNKRYPSAAQSEHQEDVVYVRLVIDSSGRLQSANVVRSRGFAMLDDEVISLAHRSSPFPAPPAAEGNPVVVVVPVEFFITRHHDQAFAGGRAAALGRD
jgi:protein TonB